MSLVVDASVALAWCFEDEQTPALMDLLDQVALQGAVAPQIWPLEVLNGLLMAQRRSRLTSAIRHRLARSMADLPIRIDTQTASRAWSDTMVLAEQHALTAYDAAYLELALRAGLPLATRDRALIGAAETMGVDVLPLVQTA